MADEKPPKDKVRPIRPNPARGLTRLEREPGLGLAIVEAIRNGNYAQVACKLCGVGESSYYEWVKRGEADIKAEAVTPFSEWVKDIRQAEAFAEDRAVKGILVSGAVIGDRTNWQAYAWYLERKYPDRWAKRLPEGEDGSTLDELISAIRESRRKRGRETAQ